MKLSDFDYYLPEELIAQSPLEKRDASKLLVLDRKTGNIEHKNFSDIGQFFTGNEVLVRNNTRVLPARLFGTKDSGAAIELLLLKKLSMQDNSVIYEALAKPARRMKLGSCITFKKDVLTAKVLERRKETVLVKFYFSGIFEEVLSALGEVPLPKYIKSKLEDADRYQTIYAKQGASAAAPTAGLHFTENIFQSLQDKGVEILDINLDVGLGTFAPIRTEKLSEHQMHSETFNITKTVADKINTAKKTGRPIVALGTTTTRALESAWQNGKLNHGDFETDIFIKPGYKFNVIDELITNFHLPKSTLLMLVSAFAGRKNILRAYNEAVKLRYRFFSFGDAMLITTK